MHIQALRLESGKALGDLKELLAYIGQVFEPLLAGIDAGACDNPAILAYSNRLAPTERPDLGYAMIFPRMSIVKILFVDIVPALFRNLKRYCVSSINAHLRLLKLQISMAR